MRTVEPVFKEEVLERLFSPTPKDPNRPSAMREGVPTQGALLPTGSSDVDSSSVQQQIQHQGMSIDLISSSVNNLHDTMTELKTAFTALRIELNGAGRFPSGLENANNDFDMISTVLKELKSKSEEIERLKLEIEALKLKNKYLEERSTQQPTSSEEVEGPLPKVQSPGLLLQGSRKRSWPDSFPNGRTQPVADSFDDDDGDVPDDISLADAPLQTMKVPLREPGAIPVLTDQSRGVQSRPEVRVDGKSRQHTPRLDGAADAQRETGQRVIVKRPRLTKPDDDATANKAPEKRRPGRPRKSFSQTPRPDLSQTPKSEPLSEQNGNLSLGSQRENTTTDLSPSEPSTANRYRQPHSKNLRSRSRPPPVSRANQQAERGTDNPLEQDASLTDGYTMHGPSNRVGMESASATATPEVRNTQAATENPQESSERRKSQVAARDILAKLAMQREEAMEMEEAR